MAKKTQKHIIKNLVVDLTLEGADKEQAGELQRRFVQTFIKTVGERLDQLFSRLAPPDVVIHLDRLDIDLGEITLSRIERDLEQQALVVIEKALRKKLAEVQGKRDADTVRQQRFTRVALLEEFLQQGHYPSWAGTEEKTPQAILRELMEQKPEAVARVVLSLAKNKQAFKRLLYQFSTSDLKTLIQLLYKDQAQPAMKQMKVLRKRLGKDYSGMTKNLDRSLIEGALQYILAQKRKKQRGFQYEEKHYIRTLIETAQQRLSRLSAETIQEVTSDKTGIQPDAAEEFTDMDLVQYFLRFGSIPIWGQVSSQENLHQIIERLLGSKLSAFQYMVERNLRDTAFMQRLVFQLPEAFILRLLEPTTDEALAFIELTTQVLTAVAGKQSATTAKQIRLSVLQATLTYVFGQKRVRFIKQTFLESAIQQSAPILKTDKVVLLKEAYKWMVRQGDNSAPMREMQATLTEVDKEAIDALAEETAEIQALQQEQTAIQTALAQDVLDETTITTLSQQLGRIEYLLQEMEAQGIGTEGKEQAGLPIAALLADRKQIEKQLERIERQLRQGARLEAEQLQQLERTKESYRAQLKEADERMKRYQAALPLEINAQLDKHAALQTELLKGSDAQRRLAAKKIEKTELRLRRLQNELGKAIDYLQQDKRSMELRLVELQSLLRSSMPSEERRIIETEIAEIEAILQRLAPSLKALQQIQKSLRQRLAPAPQKTTGQTDEEIDLTATDADQTATRTSKLDFLIAVLQYGSIPWWAEEYRNQSLEAILMEAAKENTAKLRQALQQVGKNPIVWERLVNQLSDKAIEDLLEVVQPGQVGILISQALLLERIHQAAVFPAISKLPVKYFTWGKIVEIVLSRPFTSVNTFVRELVTEISREFSLSPKQLMEYLGNLSKHLKEARFAVFQNILPAVAQDPELEKLETEYQQSLLHQPETEADKIVGDKQKVEWLVSFLQSGGSIAPDAKKAGFDNSAAMERLFLELLEGNAPVMYAVLSNILQEQSIRRMIVRRFQPEILWEVVQVILPKAVLVMQGYLDDLAIILSDKSLIVEREAALEYATAMMQKDWDAKDLVRFILQKVIRQSNRAPLAVLEEWKRGLWGLEGKAKSSFALTVLALEADWLKAQQKKAATTEDAARLQQQIETLNESFFDLNQRLLPVLHRESILVQGIPEEAVTMAGLFERVRQLRTDINVLQRELDKVPADRLAERIEMQRKIAHLEAQAALWERRKPAGVRFAEPLMETLRQEIMPIERQLKALKAKIETLEQSTPVPPPPPAPSPEEDRLLVQLSVEQMGREWNKWAEQVRQATERDLPFLERIAAQIQRLLPQITIEAVRADYEQLLTQVQAQLAAFALEDTGTLETSGEVVLSQLPAADDPAVQTWRQTIRQAFRTIKSLLSAAPISELIRHWETAQQARIAYERQMIAAGIPINIEPLLRHERQWQRTIRIEQSRRRAADLASFRQAAQQLLAQFRTAEWVEQVERLEKELDALRQQQFAALDDWERELWDETDKRTLAALRATTEAIFEELRYEHSQQLVRVSRMEQQRLSGHLEQRLQEWDKLDSQRNKALEAAERNAEKQQQAVPKELLQQKKQPVQQPQKKVQEPLLVRNAGLVILWPYVNRLFKMLNYTDGKAFLSDDLKIRAVHLLQYLATGQTTTPENELVLNKVMCALPIATPVPLSVDFTEEELKVADGLLFGAVANWSKMKSMSPAALRGTFIIRTGSMVEEADRWRLRVDKGPYDIILKTLPWGYTFVKLQWMEKFITVEWGDTTAPPTGPMGGIPTK